MENIIEECKLFTKSYPSYDQDSFVVVGKGSKNPDLLIIGEAPGKHEAYESGKPFTGKSGKLVDSWLDIIPIKNIGIINSVFFIPLEENKVRKPTEEEINDFRPYVIKIIQASKPKYILLLGDTACKSVLNQPIRECFGVKNNAFNATVYTLYHPAYYLRNGINGIVDLKKLDFYYDRKLVFDIETNSENEQIADHRCSGAYSFLDDKYYHFTDLKEFQQLINRHNIFIGYNILGYDIKVLNRLGIRFQNGSVFVDLYKAITSHGRSNAMKLDKLENNKLGTVVKFLNLGEKMDTPLELLKKEYSELKLEEREMIEKYLYNDVMITKKLFDWWYNWSKPLEDFISIKNIREYRHLTCSTATYAYKAICHNAKLPEDYLQFESVEDSYEGALTFCDVEGSVHGNIVSMDFSSLYPHNEIQGNLFSPVMDDYNGKVFEKNDFFPNLSGRYKADEQGKIESTLIRLYKLRQSYKKVKDAREYAIKIILNSAYGASKKSYFKSIHNPTVASDTTYIGRQCILHVRKRFAEEGFKLLYSDTDSLFILIPPEKTEEDVNILREKCIKEIQSYLPFPADTFNLVIENHIKYFQTFKKKDTNEEMRKLYLYVKNNDELIVKGLPVVKSNCTPISKMIFNEMKEDIIKNLNCELLTKEILNEKIIEYAKKDISLLAVHFKINSFESYKVPTQLQAQISKIYGGGHQYLIKNKRIGAGEDIKYCNLEEAKKLSVSDLDFSTVYNEMRFFMKPIGIQKKLF